MDTQQYFQSIYPVDNTTNWIGKVQEYLAINKIYEFNHCHKESLKQGMEHQPTFIETYLTSLGEFKGFGPTKQRAKNEAYRKIFIALHVWQKQLADLKKQESPKPPNTITIQSVQLVEPKKTETDKKTQQPIGTALYPFKRMENDKSQWAFIRKEYYNENQELYHYSKNADCYRNYKIGEEFSRVPDLSGFENQEYTNYRLNQARKIQKKNSSNLYIPLTTLPLPEPQEVKPDELLISEEYLKRLLTRISTEVSSMLSGDDYDKDFLKKYVVGVDSPQTVIDMIKSVSNYSFNRNLNQKDKEGGFNPYGNGQYSMEQFTMTKPGYNLADQTWTCFSTCLMPDPVHIIGTGATQTTAFEAWMSKCSEYMDNWAPVESNTLLTEIRKLPKPSTDSFILPLWESDEPIKYFRSLVEKQLKYTDKRTYNQKDNEGTHNPYGNGQPTFEDTSRDHGSDFIPGTFNPYGNGQTTLLTRDQYLTQNKKSFMNLTKAEKEEKWRKYKVKHSINKNAQPKTRVNKTQTMAVKGNLPKTTQVVPITRAKARRYVQHLSPCAKAYLVALKCPFFWLDQEIPKCVDINFPKDLPCIPGPDQFNTRKWSAFLRGTLTINTNAHGWICIAPDRVANNNSVLDNRSCPILTSTTSTLVAANTFPTMDDGAGAFPTAGLANNHNGDYTLAQLIINARGQGVKSRVVGVGVRVQYTGPKLTESGLAHFIVEPDHASLSNYTTTDIGKFEGYFTKNIHELDKKWIELTYSPVQPEDAIFHPDCNANATFGPTSDHYMGIMFTGLPPGDYIRYEVIFLFESIGNLIRGKTLSPVDPVGIATVLNGISTDTQAQNSTGSVPLSSVINQGKEMMSGMKDLIEQPLAMGKELLNIGKMFI